MFPLEIPSPVQSAALVTQTWHKPYTPQAICPWDQVSSPNKLTRNTSAETFKVPNNLLSPSQLHRFVSLKNEPEKREAALECGGTEPKALGQRQLPAPALRTQSSLPRGDAKRSCHDNDPPSTELLLLGTMELPWYLWLAGNIGMKWAWAQLCVNDIYKQIRFVYLYWMQTH